GEEPDARAAQLLVDVGVVDDLAGQVDALALEPFARLVGIVHGAIDAVAEAELPREVDGHPPGLVAVVVGPHLVHERAVIVASELVLDGVLEVEPLAEAQWLHGMPRTPLTGDDVQPLSIRRGYRPGPTGPAAGRG